MDIGALRHRVTLQSPESAISTSGEEALEWPGRGSVWAEVAVLTGRELEHARQVSGEVSHRVTIRWQAEVTAAWRVLWGDRTLDIEAVLPDVKRAALVLLCKELASATAGADDG